MEPDQIREDVPLFLGTVNPDAVDPNPGAQHGFGPPNEAKPKWFGHFTLESPTLALRSPDRQFP